MGKKRFLVEVPDRIKIFRGNGIIDAKETTPQLLKKALPFRTDYHDPEVCFDDDSQITVRRLRDKTPRRRDNEEGRARDIEV